MNECTCETPGHREDGYYCCDAYAVQHIWGDEETTDV